MSLGYVMSFNTDPDGCDTINVSFYNRICSTLAAKTQVQRPDVPGKFPTHPLSFDSGFKSILVM